MAGRYSKEYRPSEFVKLPFEEVAKVMAMKEQQYQQGYLQPAAYQQKMGEFEVRTPDIEYHQKLINDATNKARQLAEETYGGDYGAAASDITRTLANEASNPFYSWTKSKMDEYKKAKDIKMKLQAEGKYLGFDESLLNKSYYDESTGNINKDLKTDLQEKLNYSDKMNEIASKHVVHVQGGNEQSFGDAMKGKMQSANGRTWYDQKDTHYSGTGVANKNSRQNAYEDFKTTSEYNQMKRTLTDKNYAGDRAISDEAAETYIKKTFDNILEDKIRIDYDVNSKPVSEGVASGYNADGSKKTETNDLIHPKEFVLPETFKKPVIDETNKVINSSKININNTKKEYLNTVKNYYKNLDGTNLDVLNYKYNEYSNKKNNLENKKLALANDLRKRNEFLNKNKGLSSNQLKNLQTTSGVNLNKDYNKELITIESEINKLNNQYKDVIKEAPKLQSLNLSIGDSKVDDYFTKNDPTYSLYKMQNKLLFDKAKASNWTPEQFIQAVGNHKLQVANQNTSQYYFDDPSFSKVMFSDFDVWDGSGDMIIHKVVPGGKGKVESKAVDYMEAKRGLYGKTGDTSSDELKSDVKIAITPKGILAHTPTATYLIDKKSLGKDRANIIDILEKADNIYKDISLNSDNTINNAGSVRSIYVPQLGQNITVAPGHGWKLQSDTQYREGLGSLIELLTQTLKQGTEYKK